MSTHAVVAKDKDHGRYIHFDGYPDWVGCQIVRLIQRDGVEKVIDIICNKHCGWSLLDSDMSEETYLKDPLESDHRESERFELEPNYGVLYVPEFNNMNPDNWQKVTDGEFGYLINEDGTVEVYAYRKLVGVIDALKDGAVEAMSKLNEEIDDMEL